jgi:hypothetical protein
MSLTHDQNEKGSMVVGKIENLGTGTSTPGWGGMNSTLSVDEKKKDGILQHINDVLEKESWGDGADLLVLEVIFDKKLECRIQIKRKEPKRI